MTNDSIVTEICLCVLALVSVVGILRCKVK